MKQISKSARIPSSFINPSLPRWLSASDNTPRFLIPRSEVVASSNSFAKALSFLHASASIKTVAPVAFSLTAASKWNSNTTLPVPVFILNRY